MGQLLHFESRVFPQTTSDSPAPSCSSSLSTHPQDEDDDDNEDKKIEDRWRKNERKWSFIHPFTWNSEQVVNIMKDEERNIMKS